MANSDCKMPLNIRSIRFQRCENVKQIHILELVKYSKPFSKKKNTTEGRQPNSRHQASENIIYVYYCAYKNKMWLSFKNLS